MKSASTTFLALLAVTLGSAAPLASAQTAPPQVAQNAPADPEAEVDDGLKNFGYTTGLALGCVAKEQRVALQREAVDLNAEITRLLGSDRAFLFAASFGYGTTIEVKTSDCKAVLDRYTLRVAKFREGRGGRK